MTAASDRSCIIVNIRTLKPYTKEQVSMEETTTELLSSSMKDGSTGMGMFTNKETLHLIECVRRKPKLWHRQYLRKRVSSCVAEWDDIQQNEFPGYTVPQLKVRWKTMRDCFRRESKRLESGDLTASRWPLYDHMKFLDGHFRLNVRHRVSTAFARRNVTLTASKEPIKASIKREEVAQHVPSPTCTEQGSEMLDEHSGRLIVVEAEDAPPVGISEVTYCNKFRSRLRSDPISPEGGGEGWNAHGHDTTDSQFLMSLVPFLSVLPMDKNLEIRLKVLQLIAHATQSLNGSERK
ncbi:uncharacterized protein LOC118503130 isoform X1 [Anopheles stephensi]|uniref:uncharacterized protein LOC118503130 isoform X1 n=2 Tax=Anopheles stephensi TaxID=30069 RepID=UPI0016588296|nr:uncharacterized protein LOC118503130 isoform X1 [Anopheles stephensi]